MSNCNFNWLQSLLCRRNRRGLLSNETVVGVWAILETNRFHVRPER